jgi:RNA polymerase sigma-70 factor (ECF subfamily)
MESGGDADDYTLLERTAAGDFDAFDILFARHRQAVFGFTLRMLGGDVAMAEDLTQECFLRLWRSRESYRRGPAAVRTYLFTIVRNLCLDERKRKRVRVTPASGTACDAASDATTHDWERRLPGPSEPERSVLVRELGAMLEDAIRRLPEDLREVVLLREIEALSYDEIARVTGCPLGTVKSRLNVARSRLRIAVIDYLEESSGR